MQIALIGLNQDTAPIQIRNQVAYTDSQKIEAINVLLDMGIDEAAILATCGRNEIYISGREKDLRARILQVETFFEEFFNVPGIRKHLYIKTGEAASRHLISVACGLDSIVLGEDQILGQVKDAHGLAMDLGGTKKVLNRLFREAVTAAKRIKTELRISEHPMSLSYIGVKFLLEQLGTFEKKRFLIIGTGKMGRLALRYVMDSKPGAVYMTNRNHQKVIDLRAEFPEIRMVPYEERYEILRRVDVLITATASSHHVVRREDLLPLEGPLAIMDLAVPQDVDEAVGALPEVTLYNVDSLMRVSEENEQRRRELAEAAQLLIEEYVDGFSAWLKASKVDPVIEALNGLRQEIEADTFDYLEQKVVMDAKDRRLMEKMISSALKRMVREPIMRLKDEADEEKAESYCRMLAELYRFGGR